MEIEKLLQKPLWQMTGEEFVFLCQSRQYSQGTEIQPPDILMDSANKEYVYGMAGIAKLFGCSIPTANRIKQSGKIDKAITQIGRKIIVDANLALELAGRKSNGRK